MTWLRSVVSRLVLVFPLVLDDRILLVLLFVLFSYVATIYSNLLSSLGFLRGFLYHIYTLITHVVRARLSQIKLCSCRQKNDEMEFG